MHSFQACHLQPHEKNIPEAISKGTIALQSTITLCGVLGVVCGTLCVDVFLYVLCAVKKTPSHRHVKFSSFAHLIPTKPVKVCHSRLCSHCASWSWDLFDSTFLSKESLRKLWKIPKTYKYLKQNKFSSQFLGIGSFKSRKTLHIRSLWCIFVLGVPAVWSFNQLKDLRQLTFQTKSVWSWPKFRKLKSRCFVVKIGSFCWVILRLQFFFTT